MIVILLVIISIFVFHHFRVNQHSINPSTLWIILQIVLIYGTLNIVDTDKDIEYYYLFICCYGFLMFMVGNSLASLIHPVKALKQKWSDAILINDIDKYRSRNLILLLILSIIINIVYYYAIGYNVFTSGMVAFLTGKGDSFDARDLRFGTYSGKNYYAPGFVNQFKNFILPSIIVLAYILHYKYRKFIKSKIVLFLLALLSLIFILGTGQRGAFVMILIYAFIFIKNIVEKVKFNRIIRIIFPFVVILFLASTLILGRSKVKAINNVDDVIEVFKNSTDRFSKDNQTSGLDAFYYTYPKEHSWGYDWAMSFDSFLPGRSPYVSLAAQTFNFKFGNTDGTQTPSIWSSTWYNFGLIGVIVVAFIMGFYYHLLFWWFLQKKKTISNIYTFSFLTITFGSWVVSGPDYLILNGLLVFTMFKLFFKSKVLQFKLD